MSVEDAIYVLEGHLRISRLQRSQSRCGGLNCEFKSLWVFFRLEDFTVETRSVPDSNCCFLSSTCAVYFW